MKSSNQSPKAHASSMGHNLASTDWIDIHFLAMQPEYEQMLSWVGIQSNWQVLDAGCGTGSYLPLMTELVGNVLSLTLNGSDIQVEWSVNPRLSESG